MSVPVFESRGGSRLVVLLHAYTHNRQRLRFVRDAVLGVWPDADVFVPDLPFARWSVADPVQVAAYVLKEIDQRWMSRLSDRGKGPYRTIAILGHSLGALIARKVYVLSCGETNDAPFELALAKAWPRDWRQPLEWADKVDRIVLLAGMNRGWSVSHHLSVKNAILWSVGSVLGNAVTSLVGRRPLILGFRRGAPFITQLRIQWLRMRQRAWDGGPGAALTIQLLGSIDDMVSPEDNVDLVAGRDFLYLEVPRSGHSDVIQMDESGAGQGRREILREALTSPIERIATRAISPADTDETIASVRENVSDVIFVVHGIRDLGYWTRRIAARVKTLGAQAGRTFETETSTYGYFPMLPFLLPSQRRAKVEWFMDRYAEAVARYPQARFSFMGHSNGTYLLARALADHPCCRFRHVVFAGSVVRSRYDWASLIASGQVGAVLNYVATADWVVALFPKLFEVTRLQDLGSAGHDGFEQARSAPASKSPLAPGAGSGPIRQCEFVRGGHSAALVEANWESIARFIVYGPPAATPPALLAPARNQVLALVSSVTPLLWILIAGGALALGVELVRSVEPEWARTLVGVSYCGAVWKILTRF